MIIDGNTRRFVQRIHGWQERIGEKTIYCADSMRAVPLGKLWLGAEKPWCDINQSPSLYQQLWISRSTFGTITSAPKTVTSRWRPASILNSEMCFYLKPYFLETFKLVSNNRPVRKVVGSQIFSYNINYRKWWHAYVCNNCLATFYKSVPLIRISRKQMK